MTWTQTTLNIKDAAGSNQPVIAYTDGTNFSFAHPLLDGSGAIISTSNGLPILDAYLPPAAVSWTSSTTLNTAQTSTTSGMDTVIVSFVPGGTITGGVITFEVYDGAAWLPVKAARIESYNTEGTYALSGTTRGWQIPVAGFPQFRVRLSTVITGTGTAAITTIISSAPDTSVVTVGMDPAAPLSAGTNIIGKVTTDQTTHGTTDLVAADITKVAGATIAQGHGTAATAIRVELPTDGTGIVGLAASPNTVGALTTGGQVVAGSTITRPANTTAYVAGYLVANSTTAGSVTYPTVAAARGTNIVSVATRCSIKKTGTSLTNAIFRVHFYNAQPTVTNGDGAAWLTGSANYLGFFDVTCTQVFSDGAIGVGIPGSGSMMTFAPASGTSNLYFLIEARAAYTPISGEVFTVSLEVN